jgi:hypothetical protein
MSIAYRLTSELIFLHVGSNRKKHKEYIHQSGLLITGKDVSKAKDDVCMGTLEGVRYITRGFW